ncbi:MULTISPECIES: sulfate transporter family protein [unclassified Rhizobium]|uniref:sulfate transporter family protein n=1 Tax=unclassified Rhizobium TaxID=2613769 RepID=UPI001ADC4693|nr:MULTISPECIES: sulfate transporter family protein [unclassified Rhizobium]MBO9099845.1 sulfate transporter family protein [Rhizobium sp. L58/93]MBO9169834.1 sulfate transporter family protein [Rhizobium sp. L245/93]MBO9185792.1 sulfate transporter family protein [Rhizobium sp. E27B/91]QXZ82554.1 sulfate transporter family protein [Rhizobium sp. K1/93]QXZ89934.1 sulfate transporter family protein [Rhizobium sp. K15/93]
MIIESARLAVANLLAPDMRRLVWKVLGLSIAVLICFWLALQAVVATYGVSLLHYFFSGLPAWVDWLAVALAAVVGLGAAFLLAPVTGLVAGLFLDDVAAVVERQDYPLDVPGKAMPFGPAMVSSIKFLGVLIVGNGIALILLIVPGVNLVAFFLVNGYLLGREFFEFAASRFRSPQQARNFRKKNASTVFLAGLVIAAFLAIPFVNLLTPLFAGAMMVHLHKRLTLRDPSFSDELRR